MSTRKPRYSKDEFSRRGQARYEEVRLELEATGSGRIVAIDIEPGQFAVADDVLQACKPLIEQNPDSQIWTARIGERAVHRIGAWHGGPSST